jgi:ATP synthase protein I
MKPESDSGRFPRDVDKSARELMKARREKRTLWRYAYLLGAGGWLFAIPVVGGAYLGKYLDGKFGGSGISWTLTFLILGIVFGVYNVWRFFTREFRP